MFQRVQAGYRCLYSTGSRVPPVSSKQREQARSIVYYAGAVIVGATAAAYASVPLYKMFCQATGYAGAVQRDKQKDLANMEPVRYRPIKIQFNADTAAAMRWQFRPLHKEITVVPGETALAFYSATNPTDKAVIGVSTYNVVPFEAGIYFNKIQCFCFEEQRLNPHEQVDLPVLFYIDPDFVKDATMAHIDRITLSYTFFEARNAQQVEDLLEKNRNMYSQPETKPQAVS